MTLPLLRRFPTLRIARAALGTFPTSVQRVSIPGGGTLLLKRDDLTANPIGGNKVRGLEWLLGDVHPGETVLTVGPRGSTHALATATYARKLGAATIVVRWNQEMNDAARAVDARMRSVARTIDAWHVVPAYVVATALRGRGGHWIPAGGASPLGVLGHVNGALELDEQIRRGECESPGCILVPFGTGCTAAGIALGLRVADRDVPVIAVRVVPRVIASPRRIRGLARAAARMIERATGERLPLVRATDIELEHDFYGGKYGRALARDAARELPLGKLGITLDDTYSRKAFAAALARRDALPLLWLTFDGRLVPLPPRP